MATQDSKAAKIRQWLLSGKPLTQWEATMRFHYLRLGALVHEMRHAGHNIKTELIEQEGGSHYAKYQLETTNG